MMLRHILQYTGQLPQQRVIWPKMVTEPRLRILGLMKDILFRMTGDILVTLP